MPKRVGKSGEVGVITIRAPRELITALTRRVKAERAAHPCMSISQADVARELLWGALLATKDAP